MADDRWDSERADTLARRIDVLARLCESPAHKRDLVADMDHSRSTLDRAVRNLEEMNLVERREEGIAATAAGRLAVEHVTGFREGLDDLIDAQPVLSPLPPDASVTPSVVAGSETVVAAEPAPYRPVERFHDVLADADRYRSLLPLLDDPRHVRTLYEHVVTGGQPAELVVTPELFETLRGEFPRRTAAMAEEAGFRVLVTGNLPAFGLAILGTEAAPDPTVATVVFDDDGTVHGLLENDSAAAIGWAEEQFRNAVAGATDRTGALTADADGGVRAGAPRWDTSPRGRSLPVGLERAGFVRLDASYFRNEPVADPTTAWRTGLSIPEVHTGYAVERTRTATGDAGRGSDDGRRRTGESVSTMTTTLVEALSTGTDCALLGPPGAGKSTVCKRVACEWYDADRGPVLYRESGRGRGVESVEDLVAAVEAAEGHALVVVEDAVRPETNATFGAVERLADREDVSFLLDARETEWTDPPDSVEVPDEVRVEHVPSLDDRAIERVVEHFERTAGETVGAPVDQLESELRAAATGGDGRIGGMLPLLHRLATYADPLADERTSLEEAAAALYDDLDGDDLALSVCTLANALNAAGVGVTPHALYAVADPGEYDAVDDVLDRLEGRVLFPREDEAYRTVHASWSVAFLAHLIDAEGETAAAERFGECVSELLALADDPRDCDRIAEHLGEPWPLAALLDDPGGWADGTAEAVYAMGREMPKLATLFGDGQVHSVTLPDACSARIADRRWAWLARLCVDGNYYDRALAAVRRGLSTVDEESPLACRLLGVRATVLTGQGDLDGAREAAERQRELAAGIGARDLEADALGQLADVTHSRGEFERAIDLREEALDVAEALGEREAAAVLRKELGNAQFGLGNYDEAREHYETSLEVARDLGDRHLAAACLGNLATIAHRSREWERSRRYLTRTLQRFRAIGDRKREVTSLVNLGTLARQRGDYDTAREYHEEGLALASDIGERWLRVENRRQLGVVANKRGDFERARRHLENALAAAREIDDRMREASCHNALGWTAVWTGSTDEAREHFEDALGITREEGIHDQTIAGLIGLGAVARERGDHEEARQHLEAADDERTEDGSEVGRIRLGQARLALAEGAVARGRERAETARETFVSMGATHDEAKTRTVLGRLAAAAGDHGGARDHLEAALTTMEEIGAYADALSTAAHLVDVREAAGLEAVPEDLKRRSTAIVEDAPESAVDVHREWVDEFLDVD